jgi:hypothetical protein
MLQVIHQGRELGRDCLDLRICACPSRDKKKKEKVVDPEENEAVQGKLPHSRHHAQFAIFTKDGCYIP